MKKFLLASAAVMAVGAGSAMAQEVTVGAPFQIKISGQLNNMLGFNAGQKNAGGLTSEAMVQQNRLRFDASSKADNGLTFGSRMDFQTQADAGNGSLPTAGSPVIDQAWFYVKGPNFGLIEGGNRKHVQNIMPGGDQGYTPSTIATLPSGNGPGLNGGVYTGNLIGDVSGSTAANTVTVQGLASGMNRLIYLGSEPFISSRTTKIAYTTPRFSGFALALSFSPDGTNRAGTQGIRNQTQTTAAASKTLAGQANFYNWIEVGADYTGGSKEFGYSAGIQYGHASAKNITGGATKTNDIDTVYGGAQIKASGFTVGFGITFDGKSRQFVDNTAAHTDINHGNTIGYAGGVEYVTGPWLFGLWGQYAEAAVNSTLLGKSKLTNGGINTMYQLAPGITPYAEVYVYNYKDQVTTASYNNTSAEVFLLGTRIAF